MSAGEFELAASSYYNEHLATLEKHVGFASYGDTPLFLDADPRKDAWATPYHNLMHGGQLDERHMEFLEHFGLDALADECLAAEVGSAFNGDHQMLAEFRRLIRFFAIRTVIETGTHFGNTTALLSRLAEHVVSIESDVKLFQHAAERLASLTNVVLRSGDSAALLEDAIRVAPAPLLVYLDAHGASGTPLLAELEAIARSGRKPIIAIHDFYVPGADFGFDTYDGQDYRWDWIEPNIHRIYGADGYLYYYNRRAAGARRGVVYVVPRA
jgi:protein-L-isoaspartate O-methyltransferase